MRFVFLLVPLFLLPVAAVAQDSTRTLSVYGTGYVEGPADRATVTLTVEGSGSSLRAAVADAQEKVAETTASLRTLGLPETAFSTARFTGYDDGRPFLFAQREYKTSIVLEVTVDDRDLLGAVVLDLSESPIQRITGIQFSLRDLDALRGSARRAALADAETKADEMADQLGLRLGSVLKVAEEPTVRMPPYANYSASGLQVAERVIVTGERGRPVIPELQALSQRFGVQASVHLTYALASR